MFIESYKISGYRRAAPRLAKPREQMTIAANNWLNTP